MKREASLCISEERKRIVESMSGIVSRCTEYTQVGDNAIRIRLYFGEINGPVLRSYFSYFCTKLYIYENIDSDEKETVLVNCPGHSDVGEMPSIREQTSF